MISLVSTRMVDKLSTRTITVMAMDAVVHDLAGGQ